MKNNPQHRPDIKLHRRRWAERPARRATARPVDRPVATATVAPALRRPTTRFGIPEFVQRGDYQEVAQGEVWTTAVRCRTCRQQERARKAEARRVHWAGLAMRRERSR